MSKRILVVEDQEDLSAILRDFLSASGYIVIEAVDGAESVTKAASMLEEISDAMLSARARLLTEFTKLHKAVLRIVRQDEVCRRFMTMPPCPSTQSLHASITKEGKSY
jgi:CheY-like chemotaxis protein